ncbi:MAG: ABC transporter substrate-binding protein [Arcobacteraceae bacterium]|nr:ABC transporter substrate-binding protein [Arcobacteraceae bacterium]
MNKRVYIFIVIFTILLVGIFFNTKSGKDEIKTYTVAFVSLSKVDDNTFNGFKKQMQIYGWEENKNIKYIVPGAAKKVKNLKSIVKSVVEKKPDIILVSSTPATQEVKRATKNLNIPVVFCPVNDPINSNILVNQNAPEGHITGIRLPIGDAKRFEWLHTIAPDIKKVLVPYTPNDGGSIASRADIKEVAEFLNINIIEKPFPENITMKEFLKQCAKCQAEAIFLPRDSRIEVRIKDFSKYAIENKLPLSAPSYQQVQQGALFTYGFIHTELGKQAARMVDRILKGVKPTDLPVKFGNAYLVINKKTAKSIGIKFPKNAIRNAKLIIK